MPYIHDEHTVETLVTPEYLEYRCCMCPNLHSKPESAVCPAGGPQRKPETQCRFVKRYRDRQGRTYFVSPWKKVLTVFIDTSGKKFEMRSLPRRDSFDTAQSDLNAYAKRSEWEEA